MQERPPPWIKVRYSRNEKFDTIRQVLRLYGLHTVCEEASCPNIGECWGGGTATFMILGDTCTRACRFCNVKSGNPRGWLDVTEPLRVARALRDLALDYIVITSVDRDDLPDGGASHFANVIREVKALNRRIFVEVLIPDFQGDLEALSEVVSAGPDVISHNIECVERLTPLVRDRRASYRTSLKVLRHIKELNPAIFTKSSIMVGLGEAEEEVYAALEDLRGAGVDIVTIGQYLRPSSWHLPVVEYVPPDKFERYRRRAYELGFLYCAAGPLVRTSYRAGEYFIKEILASSRGTS
jgi:lipoic acid synthetase